MIALAHEKPPIIGISGYSADSASVRAMMTQIRDAGGIPMFLGNHSQRDTAQDIQKIDALIMLGNNADIDPTQYHEAKDPATKSEISTPEGVARAVYEEKMLSAALEKKMPILGVCGGMQRLNVWLGGSLYQDIPKLVGSNVHAQQDANIAPFIPVQPVIISQDSTLGHIAEDTGVVFVPTHDAGNIGFIMENSMHHQAVHNLGNGLRVAATAEDKLPSGEYLTEAIEADPKGQFGGQFIEGVQWHPEFGASKLGKLIADRVVAEGQTYAQQYPHEITLTQVMDENKLSSLPVAKPAPNATIRVDNAISVSVASR